MSASKKKTKITCNKNTNMKILPALILLATFQSYFCVDVKELFEKINKKTEQFNAKAAEIAWESSVNPGNTEIIYQSEKYQKERITWQQSTCDELATLHNSHLLNNSQARQTYLLCRGPKYTFSEARLTSELYEELQKIYTEAEVCITTDENITNTNLTQVEDAILKYISSKSFLKRGRNKHNAILDYLTSLRLSKRGFIRKKKHSFFSTEAETNKKAHKICLKGEDDFQNLMAFSRKEKVLKWLWLVWREKVASLKEPYLKLVNIENAASRRNGYPDIGASWRDDQEVPNLRKVCQYLFQGVRPLYSLLHGVVRFFLRREYGSIVPERGPIPAHLLGNLWSQNWEPLADLILPRTINLDESIRKLNWTVEHMVKRAEDFYQSLDLPPMTKKFWEKSVFRRKDDKTRCHGAAADMFISDDFRLLYCSGTKMEDFYVLHHELGHIQYYMAYEKQPALFRQANTALHEAIGDTIMYGVMTPQHLYRLNLINDSILYENGETDENNDHFNTNHHNDERFVRKDEFDTSGANNKEVNTNEDLTSDVKMNVKDVINFDMNNNFNVRDLNDYKNVRIPKLRKKVAIDENENENYGEIYNKEIKDYKHNYERITKNYNDKLFNFQENNEFKNKDSYDKIDPILNNKEIKFNKEIDIVSKDTKEKLHITADEIFILKQGLNKIPQIPFSLLIDEYRWKLFEGMKEDELNKMFWDMSLELQGISPPVERGEEYFDAGAKFHVPDNTPYIRYFLSSFLQHQLFESLCKAAVFGRRDVKEDIPETMALHRCDIYGSKSAGKLLKDIMSRGHSQHWKQILQETIASDISTTSLKRYYQPLYKLLNKLVRFYHIPIGW